MQEYGWEDDPADSKGVIRSRTKIGQLRLWTFPRTTVRHVNTLDFAGSDHPGLYILRKSGTKKVYVGESNDLRARLETHAKNGPKELKDWDTVTIINDGRNYLQSLLTDTTIRLFLEKRLIDHLQNGKICQVVNFMRKPPNISLNMLTITSHLDPELQFTLLKRGLIEQKPITVEVPQDVLEVSQIEQVLSAQGKDCKLQEKNGTLDGKKVFVRPGSDKPRGWQITIRGKFLKAVKAEDCYVLINRGYGYLIPSKVLNAWQAGQLSLDTRDIYVRLDEEKAYSKKETEPLNISPYRIIQPPTPTL